jgi:uncharacterized protein with ParB-like and HNH nuclease domain
MKAENAGFLDGFLRLSVGAQYVIPVYQRNYNWKREDQVKQFINDIEILLENPQRQHFVGSLVYCITKDTLNGQERSIVDGQQRLTTLMLLLYAIKHVAKERSNDAVAKAINNNYLENREIADKYKLRLKPSVSDDDDYKEIALGNDDLHSTSNVGLNYAFCKEQVGEWIDRGFSYDQIINAIKRLQIISILLKEEDGDNPQQIFESINSTGMELIAADLIRNYILMNKDNDTQEKLYTNYWRKLENLLPNPRDLESFLRLYLANKQMYLTSKKNVYSEFKKYWNEQLKNVDESSLLQDILRFGEHYYRLYYSNDADVLGEELVNYRVLRSDMPAPFTMQVMELLRTGAITVEQASSVIRLINIYLIRRYITNLDTNDISRYFPTYLRLVRERCAKEGYKNFYKICKDVLINSTRQKTSYIPDDADIKNYLKTANAYNLKNIRWILEKIELKKSNVPIEPGSLSIEHVMPQTKGTAWTEANNVSFEEYVSYVNRLGNLTLAAKVDNTAMGNRSFAVKKEILHKSSHIKMNEYFFKKKKWGFSEIDARTDAIINEILQLFPIDVSNYVETRQDFDVVIIKDGRALAYGYFYGSDKNLRVKAGSNIILDKGTPQTKSASELREELRESNGIFLKAGKYLLREDITFDSPSTAAEFVLGGSKNGWDYWRRASDEKTLSSIKKEQ